MRKDQLHESINRGKGKFKESLKTFTSLFAVCKKQTRKRIKNI
jgi:hypothetical protein